MATSIRSHQSRYLASLLLLWIIPLTVYGLAASTSKKRNSGTGFGATKKDSWRLHTPDDTTTTATLTAFLSKQKAAIENTEIGLDPVTGERGLYATKNFKEGQIICKVPSDCALALSDPALAVKDQEAPTLADGGLFFLQQYWKDTTARKLWAPYLDTLPVSARAAKTPDLYQDDELDLLEFPRIVNKARQRQAEVRDLAAAATKDSITLEELQFATWLVSTRAFPIQLADQDDAETAATALDERGQVISKAARKWIRVLVPWIDVTNHAAAPNAALTLQDPEKDQAWFALKVCICTHASLLHYPRSLSLASRFSLYIYIYLIPGDPPHSTRT